MYSVTHKFVSEEKSDSQNFFINLIFDKLLHELDKIVAVSRQEFVLSTLPDRNQKEYQRG